MKKRILITAMLFASLSVQTITPVAAKTDAEKIAAKKKALKTIKDIVKIVNDGVSTASRAAKLAARDTGVERPIKAIGHLFSSLLKIALSSMKVYEMYQEVASLTPEQLDEKGPKFLPKKTSELVQAVKNLKGQKIDMDKAVILLFQVVDMIDAFIARFFETHKPEGTHYHVRKLVKESLIFIFTLMGKKEHGELAMDKAKEKVKEIMGNAEKLYKVFRSVLDTAKVGLLPKVEALSEPPAEKKDEPAASFDDFDEEDWNF